VTKRIWLGTEDRNVVLEFNKDNVWEGGPPRIADILNLLIEEDLTVSPWEGQAREIAFNHVVRAVKPLRVENDETYDDISGRVVF
jgi:hypothetical protein